MRSRISPNAVPYPPGSSAFAGAAGNRACPSSRARPSAKRVSSPAFDRVSEAAFFLLAIREFLGPLTVRSDGKGSGCTHFDDPDLSPSSTAPDLGVAPARMRAAHIIVPRAYQTPLREGLSRSIIAIASSTSVPMVGCGALAGVRTGVLQRERGERLPMAAAPQLAPRVVEGKERAELRGARVVRRDVHSTALSAPNHRVQERSPVNGLTGALSCEGWQ